MGVIEDLFEKIQKIKEILELKTTDAAKIKASTNVIEEG